MKLKTNIGQIFLTHPSDQNFASIYEESLTKQGTTLELFGVFEISGNPTEIRSKKDEYDRTIRAAVTSFKKAFITAPAVDEETFETALANINQTLGRIAAKSKTNWYGRLNAVVAAVHDNKLALSISGNAVCYLIRGSELTPLSEGLVEDRLKPTKIFSNYTSGVLTGSDRILLTSAQLLNFLSLDRIREFLAEEDLESACHEIINSLSDVKDTGFATFIFETYAGDKSPAAPESSGLGIYTPAKTAAAGLNFQNLARAAMPILKTAAQVIKQMGKSIYHFFKVRPKKYLFLAIVVVLVLLFANIGYAAWKKTGQSNPKQDESVLSQIDQKLNEADAAIIYGDENKVTALMIEAEKLLTTTSGKRASAQRDAQIQRLAALKTKIDKQLVIENPTVLTEFPNVPTQILRSPNGFLGFNRDSHRISFYDFRTGITKTILQNQNTSQLSRGVYSGSVHGYLFLTTDGKVQKLDPDAEILTDVAADIGSEISASDLARARSVAILGENPGARLYALDSTQNQIWRVRVTDSGLGTAEKWLKTAANLTNVRDIAIDGSLYALYADHTDKYFNGQKQNWQLALVNPPLENAVKIFTKSDLQAIYILDPAHKRVLVFEKNGRLKQQITSPKFNDLSDVYVDEKTSIMHLLAGSQLLQINLK